MDRNLICGSNRTIDIMSLSARRAWIEISNIVARIYPHWSLSARRAWIEMLALRLADMSDAVALRKESVDRNLNFFKLQRSIDSRSPQGERG